ncbi:MAG: protein-glutamate O-methyltransferase CheR [Spirochaetota bacterium]|nr:protein-glutamate O-methyltransferase CheR [Spirochaetota bacterium]
MNKTEIENIEIQLLLDGIYKRYGYDFRNYNRTSLKRRIKSFISKTECTNISDLLSRLLYDKTLLESMIFYISITVTEMFRDPFVYKAIREKVLPYLKTFPIIKIWHAGCATGEEVYSMAILLIEEGIYDRSLIYATDFNDTALGRAKEGIYSIDQIKQYTTNYQRSGGKISLSDYYHSEYDTVIMNRRLKKRITFANHNLVTDSAFGEMHFIICRNVMIYFNKDLQNRVFKLFYDSLIFNGFLCIGDKESLDFINVNDNFNIIATKEKIYQKKR